MKLEIHIPELAELNTNVRQLIDTLNDLAVVGINAAKREPGREHTPTRTATVSTPCVSLGGGIGASIGSGAAIVGSLGTAVPVTDEKPKRTRKVRAEEPAPEPAATDVAPQVEPEPAPTAVESEPEQPTVVEPEPQPEAPTYVLADCTALAEPIQKAQKLDEAKAWLKEHGADRLKDLDPSRYGAFITFAKGLLG